MTNDQRHLSKIRYFCQVQAWYKNNLILDSIILSASAVAIFVVFLVESFGGGSLVSKISAISFLITLLTTFFILLKNSDVLMGTLEAEKKFITSGKYEISAKHTKTEGTMFMLDRLRNLSFASGMIFITLSLFVSTH